jgi:hypothetical protein
MIFDVVLAFVKLYSGAFTFLAFVVAGLIAFALGVYLPTSHARSIAEVIGFGISAIAGRKYFP